MDVTLPSPPSADTGDTWVPGLFSSSGDTSTTTGKCLCGATSYRITKLDERSPGQILVCHCREGPHSFPKFKPCFLDLNSNFFNTSSVSFTSYFPTFLANILVCNYCFSMCRRLSGGFNMPFAAFPREYVKFEGSQQLKRIRSSEVAERLFCGGCGSQVGMDYGKALEPDSLWLTLGLEPYCNLIT